MSKVEYSGEFTNCHRHLHRILTELGFQVRDNEEYGNFRIDCAIELKGIAFEADGKFFHWKRRDQKRDKWLLNNCGITIIRILERILDGKHDVEVRKIILRNIDLVFGRDE